MGGGGSGRRESGCGEEREEEEEDQGKEEGYLCDELHLAQGLELSNGCLRDLQREEVMLVTDLFGLRLWTRGLTEIFEVGSVGQWLIGSQETTFKRD